MSEEEIKSRADEFAKREWKTYSFLSGKDLAAALLDFARQIIDEEWRQIEG